MIPSPDRYAGRMTAAFLLLAAALLFSCSTFRTAAHFQKPQVTLQSIGFQNITFETVDLVFTVAVNNPNSAAIKLNRYDYQLLVNNAPFAKGDTKRTVTFDAGKVTPVTIPVTVKFSDLYNAYQALSTRDSTEYQAQLGLYFDIPVLGEKRIQVNRNGFLPLVKAPGLEVTSVQLRDLRLAGADLDVNVMLNNPNTFSLTLRQLTYEFLVSDKSWATGTMRKDIPIGIQSRNTFTVPIAVSFLQVGQSVYDILANSRTINYRFRGNILFDTSNPMFKEINFPFDKTGQTQVKK